MTSSATEASSKARVKVQVRAKPLTTGSSNGKALHLQRLLRLLRKTGGPVFCKGLPGLHLQAKATVLACTVAVEIILQIGAPILNRTGLQLQERPGGW